MRSRWIHFVRPGVARSFAGASAVLLVASALSAGAASADMTTFGAVLGGSSATPTLDTANGDFANNGVDAPTETAPPTAPPLKHFAEDLGVWNTTVPGGSATAPSGGQILSISVEGCALKDTTAPTQPDGSQISIQTNSSGTTSAPVNFVEFQALTAQGSNFAATNTAQGQGSPFLVPFCSSRSAPTTGTVTTSTITTYQPLHMCVAKGQYVAFHDVGGFIPAPQPGATSSGTGPWYPEGIPMDVISSSSGAGTSTFIGVGTSTYGPGVFGTNAGDNATNAGFASESNQELMMEMTMGTGVDAYGQCPGGVAVEPSNSNTVTCVTQPTDPGAKYGTCNAQDQAVFAPANTAPPTISGTPQVGDFLKEAHGTWTNSPFGYKVQWERCDASGASCTAISGQTGTSYKVQSADVGRTLKVEESASNDANTVGPVSSAATAAVTAGGTLGSGGNGGNGGSGGSSKFIVGRFRLAKYAFLAAKGTTISWQDTKAGKSTLTLTKKGKKKVLWSATHQDRPGANSLKFRDTKLHKGFYTLTLKTTFGVQAKTNTLTLRIVT